jgi:DedD protein
VERHVKERLIGAAVLVAAAVILIPEMLSGPKRPATASAPARAGEVPMKTYTIDLNQSPGAQAAPPTVTEQTPPPETVPSDTPPPERPATAPTVSPPPERAPQAVVRNDAEAKGPSPSPQTIPESLPVKPALAPVIEQPRPAAAKAKEPERPAPAAVAKESAKPLAPAASAPTSKQWAVQLGSFASKTGAERLAKEYEDRGQKAFVMPVKSGNNTLYRVRLGPFAERAAADEALRKVGNRVAGAAVVAHP